MLIVNNEGELLIGVDPATHNQRFFGPPRPLSAIKAEPCPDDDETGGAAAAYVFPDKVAGLNDLGLFWAQRAAALAKEAEALGLSDLARELAHRVRCVAPLLSVEVS